MAFSCSFFIAYARPLDLAYNAVSSSVFENLNDLWITVVRSKVDRLEIFVNCDFLIKLLSYLNVSYSICTKIKTAMATLSYTETFLVHFFLQVMDHVTKVKCTQILQNTSAHTIS